jgi:membrane-bound ClpP family serine protease
VQTEGDSDEELIGKIGRITLPVPADGPGEVLIDVRGGSEAYAAYSDEPIAKHRQVVVVEERSSRSLVVTPLPESIFPAR